MRLRSPSLGMALIAAALLAADGSPVAAQGLVRRDSLEDAPLTLVYRPYVRVIVSALQRRGAFYLPLSETLAQLAIEHHVDPRRGTVSGPRVGKRPEYRIDFNAGTAVAGERTHTLDRDSFLITELEIFVLPSMLEEIFGIRSIIDPSMLTVEIISPEELPVAETVRRRERHALFAAISGSTVAPLRHSRQRRLLDGGVLQYSLVGESGPSSDVLRFDFTGGTELLGGDFQVALRGNRGDRSPGSDESEWRWRCVVGNPRIISQLTLGRFYSSGLQASDLEGLAITNRPVEPRTRLGLYTIDGFVEPNADIELYINDHLAAVGRADPFGQYRFELPLSYGTSIVRVQSYGASGGVRRDERALQVPFALVPRGHADYDVQVGRSRQTGILGAHGRIAIGLSNSLTSSVGLDYAGGDSLRRWIPYAGLSARLGSGQVVAFDGAPRVLYRASWESMFSSRANIGATFTRFAPGSWLNRVGADEWSIRGYMPLSSRSTGAALQGQAHQRMGADGSRTWHLRGTAMAQVGPVRPLIGYDWSRVRSAAGLGGAERREVRLGAFAHVFRRARVPGWLRATMVSGWQTYETIAGELSQSQLNVSIPIARGGSFETLFERDYFSRTNRFSLNLILEHARVRSTSMVSRGDGARQLTQSLTGAVGFDSRSGMLVLSNRRWAGQSGAVMRFFLDRNGNDRFDAGEEPISGANIRLDRSVILDAVAPGVIRATDLPAYQRVTASVDVSGVRNPLWIPKSNRFAFITDPNRYKPIDIPFFAAGVVEGTVVRRIGTEERGIGGLRLHLKRVDAELQIDLPTFSDGAFYYIGLPPGRYSLEPDVRQLELLGARAEPAMRSFNVRESATGDFIDRLDFVLVPAVRPPSSPR